MTGADAIWREYLTSCRGALLQWEQPRVGFLGSEDLCVAMILGTRDGLAMRASPQDAAPMSRDDLLDEVAALCGTEREEES